MRKRFIKKADLVSAFLWHLPKSLSHFHAEIEQCIDFIGLIKNCVHTEFLATLSHIQRGVIAQHNHALVRLPVLARCNHTQPAALAQEQIYDSQIPVIGGICQPGRSFCFSLCIANWCNVRKLQQSLDEIFTDRGIVFHEECSKCHSNDEWVGRSNLKDDQLFCMADDGDSVIKVLLLVTTNKALRITTGTHT